MFLVKARICIDDRTLSQLQNRSKREAGAATIQQISIIHKFARDASTLKKRNSIHKAESVSIDFKIR
jgi:hypothetical protein